MGKDVQLGDWVLLSENREAVFRLDSLSQIEPFLFSSPDALRMLGFNMRQIQDGFYSGSKERPLNVESIG